MAKKAVAQPLALEHPVKGKRDATPFKVLALASFQFMAALATAITEVPVSKGMQEEGRRQRRKIKWIFYSQLSVLGVLVSLFEPESQEGFFQNSVCLLSQWFLSGFELQ